MVVLRIINIDKKRDMSEINCLFFCHIKIIKEERRNMNRFRLESKKDILGNDVYEFSGHDHRLIVCCYNNMKGNVGNIQVKITYEKPLPVAIKIVYTPNDELVLTTEEPLFLFSNEADAMAEYLYMVKEFEQEILDIVKKIKYNK